MTLIAIVLPDLRGGGVERVRLLLAENFTRRGLKVSLVLFRLAGELRADIPVGVNAVDLKARRLRDGLMPLVRYIRRERPAAMLAAMWPMTGLVALAKLLAGSECRLIVSEHNALSRTPAYRGLSGRVHRLFGARLYRLADGVVCVSRGVQQDIVANTGLAAQHTHVVYNPVRRLSETTHLDEETAAWFHSGTGIIAIGSLKPQKDYSTLLRAFARLRGDRDARLLILGEGPERPRLEALIAELNLGDCVRLAGFVADPYPYLALSDLFVLSSAWEGLGNVIIEALVCGTPVVSTDCPSGPAEILENGRYGRLVPVGDSEALAAAMAEALDAEHDHDALRARGAEFSVERAADQYLNLLLPGEQVQHAVMEVQPVR